PLTSRIRCSECGSFYRRKVRSGGVKWVCSKHEEDTKACKSNYRIPKSRFCNTSRGWLTFLP
ncbi:MAG: hypothetical protein E7551_07305, partial [Ruminococcaceae bacterium]|nr:hypothetical protein [Oscillospiraceae bacterium]